MNPVDFLALSILIGFMMFVIGIIIYSIVYVILKPIIVSLFAKKKIDAIIEIYKKHPDNLDLRIQHLDKLKVKDKLFIELAESKIKKDAIRKKTEEENRNKVPFSWRSMFKNGKSGKTNGQSSTGSSATADTAAGNISREPDYVTERFRNRKPRVY